MSGKRDLIARMLPRGIPFSENLNNNAAFVAMRRARFSDCPEFLTRTDMYRHLSAAVAGEPTD